MIEQFYSWVYIWKTKKQYLYLKKKKYMDPTVHSSIIYNFQDMLVT